MKNIGGIAEITFEQQGDSCSEKEVQFLTVKFKDAGGGLYMVLETAEWAIDDPEQFIKELQNVFDTAKMLTSPTGEVAK